MNSFRQLAMAQKDIKLLNVYKGISIAYEASIVSVGTTFRRLKYPFIWYDILHVVDTLSRFSFTHLDPRLLEMWEINISKQDDQGLYTPESVWMAWKEWSFGQKREPSPWLTLLAERIQKRLFT